MLRRIDVRDIITGHMDTLTEYGSDRRHKGDYLLFFVLPLLATAALLWASIYLTKEIANIVITSLSIFAGLLFNLLLLTHGMIKAAPKENENERKLIREIYSNISYAILVSVVVILVCLAFYFSPNRWFVLSVSAATHFLIINFVLTLLMILRRIHILLSREFGRS